ncbi:uncharacterized protein Dwil_GK18053 [Drosophila willistoni]|uniref:RAB6-interacting golgin n=1 Tax=Drosophila willistoni TaxID=7260 RepID=B4N6G3_DROWI|nr:RAB6-interacting golgin [Drosophila willistoni]EDW79952.1 uncharacterized protein Dwil_GK18053 [Drosophila willistoni]
MGEKFNGFSHDEIMKITGVSHPTTKSHMEAALRSQPGIRRMPDKMFRQADQLRKQQTQVAKQKKTETAKEKPLPKLATTPTPTPTPQGNAVDDVKADESLNLERGISDSLVEALYFGHKKPNQQTTNGSATLAPSSGSETTIDDSSILKISANTATTDDDNANVLPSTKGSTSSSPHLNTDSPFKGISLKDFEQHRKMIEEQNKQKKQMLYQAIEQHTQKTAAESRKIEEIRHELSKLESDLAVDVALLRKQIDNACINFANIEKHYVKIEAQFLKAKMDLHNAAERKELLTEHLCTVIAHNEDRKAQKLTELMQKVGLAPTDEQDPANNQSDGPTGPGT